MQQSGSKIAIRNMRRFLSLRDKKIKTITDKINTNSLLAKKIPTENTDLQGMDLIPDTILHIRKAFSNDEK